MGKSLKKDGTIIGPMIVLIFLLSVVACFCYYHFGARFKNYKSDKAHRILLEKHYEVEINDEDWREFKKSSKEIRSIIRKWKKERDERNNE